MIQTPSFRDVEKLSAYLDGQLKPSEIAHLETRLKTDPELAAILQSLRQSRGMLRQLPQRRAPRNFTLSPKMVGIKPPMPRAYPVFRLASALATLLLFFTFATNFMAPRMMSTAPSAPYGIGGGYGGGGGGGGGGAADSEMEMQAAAEEPAEEALESAPAPAMEAPMAPAEEPAAPEGEPAAEDSARTAPEPTMMPEPSSKTAPTDNFAQPEAAAAEPPARPAPPIGSALQIALAVVSILSALGAFILHKLTIRKWRAKAK